ncbi:hypothetical protein GCM10009689_36670 [Brevibacterium antiquum]
MTNTAPGVSHAEARVTAVDASSCETLTLGEMATEVVSILVCSIGLVIAIPLTTALGVLVVRSGLRPPPRAAPSQGSIPPSQEQNSTADPALD